MADSSGFNVILLGFILLTVISHLKGESSLQQLEKRLDDIDKKLKKVDTLLDGFAQLCSSLDLIKDGVRPRTNDDIIREGVEVNGADGILDDVIKHTIDDSGTYAIAAAQSYPHIVSIQSTGLLDSGTVNVTVVFIAPTHDYFIEWQVGLSQGTGLRRQGLVDTDSIDDGKISYTCRINLSDFKSLSFLMVMIASTETSAYITFNLTALEDKEMGIQLLKYPQYIVSNFTSETRLFAEILEKDGFETSVGVFNGPDAVPLDLYDVEVSLTYVNTSTDPPVVEDKWWSQYGEDIVVEIRNDSGTEVIIRVDKEIAVYGAIIMFRLRDRQEGGYVNNLFRGVVLRFINAAVGGLVPSNSFGIVQRPFEKEIYLVDSSISITCAGFGDPLPKVSIKKKNKHGGLKELKDFYEISYEFYAMKTATMKAQPKTVGEYICEVTDGQKILTTNYTVKPFTMVEIDEDGTRLVKNTTKKTVVVCKATGKPEPSIELNVNNRYGINLMVNHTDQYKLRVIEKKGVTKVTLTIAPPNEDISSIHCVAVQSLRQAISGGHEKTKEIYIRPAKEFDPDGLDYHTFYINDTLVTSPP